MLMLRMNGMMRTQGGLRWKDDLIFYSSTSTRILGKGLYAA
jgi:hypothetical protein